MSIFDKLLGKLSMSFLNRQNSPSNKSSFKNSSANFVPQAGHDVNVNVGPGTDFISDLEKKILQKLYKHYRSTKQLLRWPCTEAYKEFGITDGCYVGPLNDSKYLKLEGEYLILTNEGIRFMDTIYSQKRPKVDIVNGLTHRRDSRGCAISFSIKNDGDNAALDIKFQLLSEEGESRMQDINPSISSGASISNILYNYTDTNFHKVELKRPRIIFYYHDSEGNEFQSGRYLIQEKIADENYVLSTKVREYFQD